jgi:beta-galactosidase GanA
VNSIIAKNQITEGGPVILVQVENEYSGFQAPYGEDFEYQETIMQDFVSAVTTLLLVLGEETRFVRETAGLSFLS